jgi:hypothetical protein
MLLADPRRSLSAAQIANANGGSVALSGGY